jgi:hypothetical protein
MTAPGPPTQNCSNGHGNNLGAQFCGICGERLGASPPASPTFVPAFNGPGPVPPAVRAFNGPPPLPPANPLFEEQPKPGPKKAKVLIAVAAAVVVLALVVTVILLKTSSSETSFGDGNKIQGIAVLFDPDSVGTWDDCQGTGGYDDFGAGMSLTVTGKSSDETVGTGSVQNIDEGMLDQIVAMDWAADNLIGLDETKDPAAAKSELLQFLTDSEGTACLLYFEADIESSPYYSVELGHRGALSYSQKELQARDYILSVDLGD